jgi:hypothetical protein
MVNTILHVVAVAIALRGCVDGQPPSGTAPYGSGCRCDGNRESIIVARVVTNPVAYEELSYRGVRFEVMVEQVLPASRVVGNDAPAPTVGSTLALQQRMFTRDGGSIGVIYVNNPTLPTITLGVRTVFVLGEYSDENPRFRGSQPLPMNLRTDTLTSPWMQFPVGTPSSQILDPMEWNNPARGCDPACRVNGGR